MAFYTFLLKSLFTLVLEPKTRKPRPKTKNQNKPTTQISSITKFFETVFKPKEQESEAKHKNQTDENQPTETRNHEQAATTINTRKPTFDLPENLSEKL